MSDTKNDDKLKFRNSYIGWLLKNKDNAAIMSDLKRGGARATDGASLEHILPLLHGRHCWQSPMLLHASDFATFAYIQHVEGMSLGKAFRQLNSKDKIQEESMKRLLMATQVSNLANAHAMWRGKLAMLNSNGMPLDWGSLWDMYSGWDSKFPDVRRRSRRRLLEDYYSHTQDQ